MTAIAFDNSYARELEGLTPVPGAAPLGAQGTLGHISFVYPLKGRHVTVQLVFSQALTTQTPSSR